MVLKVLDVDGAVRRVKGGWVGTGQPWEYDEPRYRTLDEARRREQQAMLDYQSTDECRMTFLRSATRRSRILEAGERCGRCDNCTGAHFGADGRRSRGGADQERLMRPGVEITPRKQWPSGLGKLGVDAQRPDRRRSRTGPGDRAADRPGLGPAPAAPARRTRRPRCPPMWCEAAVKVLAAWDWATRPTAVLALDSERIQS